MNTQDFIKISSILDKYGLHKEADRLTSIAQKSTTPLQGQADNRPVRYEERPGRKIEIRNNGNGTEDRIISFDDGTKKTYKNLPEEMQTVEYETSPGNKTTGVIPKAMDPRMANPNYANNYRYKTRFDSIPGYIEFKKFKPQPFQERAFIEAKGTSTDAGMAIYNELANAQGMNTSLSAPASSPSAPVAAPAAAPSSSPASVSTPASQNVTIPDLQKRVDYYSGKIANYKKETNPNMKSKMLLWLSTHIEKNYYEDNKLDYASYKKLMTDLGEYVDLPKDADAVKVQPKSNSPVTLAPSSTGTFAKPGGTYNLVEDRNLAGLQAESNEYLSSDSFKKSLEDRINQLGGLEVAKQKAPDLVKMYEASKSGKYKQVGDLGPAELYGTKFKPYGQQ